MSIVGVEDSGIRPLRGCPKHKFGYRELIRPIPVLRISLTGDLLGARRRELQFQATELPELCESVVKSAYMYKHGNACVDYSMPE